MGRVKVSAIVSVYVNDGSMSTDQLKDIWYESVKEGKFKTGNFNIKDSPMEEKQ